MVAKTVEVMNPFSSDCIIYRHELAYLRGTSMTGYRARKFDQMWKRIRRYLTLWSLMLASGLSTLIASPAYV